MKKKKSAANAQTYAGLEKMKKRSTQNRESQYQNSTADTDKRHKYSYHSRFHKQSSLVLYSYYYMTEALPLKPENVSLQYNRNSSLILLFLITEVL